MTGENETGPGEAAIAAAIAAAAFFAQRGWVPATSGNFSVRTGAERMAITASGRDKGALTAADFIAADIGEPLPPGISAEAPPILRLRLASASASNNDK